MGLTLIFQPGPGGVPATTGPATNLYFLFNEAGRAASSIVVNTGATATGYNNVDIMSGPRSAMWRSISFSAAEIGYTYGANIGVNYAIVARADLLITAAGKHLVGRQRDSGGTWSDIPGFDLNPLTSADFLGPTSQDLVVATSPTNLRGFGLFTAPVSGTEATMFSKLYAGGAFAFSVPPSFGVQWVEYPPETYQTPLKGTMPYEVERSFSLTFDGVAQSEYTQFLRYDAFNEPFFLYDSTADIWEWQLEHVILTGLQATMNAVNDYTLKMDFYRLRHYA
jgi:hypothetical protein